MCNIDSEPITITQTLISSIVHTQHLSETTNTTPIFTENPMEPNKIKTPMSEINMIDLQKEIRLDTHRLIHLPYCKYTQFLMIDIFTDGGALHQGSSKAIAAYGAIFPHFEKHNFTKAIPSYELQTNTRAEMYAFIDAIPIAVNIAENLSHHDPIVAQTVIFL